MSESTRRLGLPASFYFDRSSHNNRIQSLMHSDSSSKAAYFDNHHKAILEEPDGAEGMQGKG